MLVANERRMKALGELLLRVLLILALLYAVYWLLRWLTH
jgi:hypothetical protein